MAELLLGLKYYFPQSIYGASVRPFVDGGVGTFVGSQTETRAGSVVSVVARTETAMGGQVNGGVDVVAGRHVRVSATLGLNLMTDFDQPIGGEWQLQRTGADPRIQLRVRRTVGPGSIVGNQRNRHSFGA